MVWAEEAVGRARRLRINGISNWDFARFRVKVFDLADVL